MDSFWDGGWNRGRSDSAETAFPGKAAGLQARVERVREDCYCLKACLLVIKGASKNKEASFMKRWIIIAAVMSVSLGSLFASEPVMPKTLKMKVDGMRCIACKEKVEKQLSAVCRKTSIDVKTGECSCEYEGKVTPKQILDEANKTGYKATLEEE